ncbi:uncharacterized protein LOC119373297 isoform X2 [Rhipicephalus sanguineus]|nr:uncharacterized protein LOC119373297 isoform X2 [Rhipicephalus sanguineus]
MTTSTRTGYDCKVDVVDNIDSEYVYFRRFLAHRKLIVNDWVKFLVGHLYHKSARDGANVQIYNAMNVSVREHGPPLDVETLVYLSIDNLCGIFAVDDMVNGGQETTFELRVKNSSILVVNETECFKPYQEMVKKQAKITYQPSCQDVLIGMNNFVPGGISDNGAVGLGFRHYSERFFIPFSPLPVAAVFLPSWLS